MIFCLSLGISDADSRHIYHFVALHEQDFNNHLGGHLFYSDIRYIWKCDPKASNSFLVASAYCGINRLGYAFCSLKKIGLRPRHEAISDKHSSKSLEQCLPKPKF